MATKKTASTEIPQQFAESANAYMDRLMKGHERFAEAVSVSRARSVRVADKFFETMLAGQRDAIELSKTLLAEPTAYSKNMEAAMQSLSVAQERALDFAKTVYREQAEAGSELREAAEKTFEAAKAYVPPMEKFTAMWNPAAK